MSRVGTLVCSKGSWSGNLWRHSFAGRSVRAGEDYSLVVTFGADGFRVYLDGELAAWRPDVVTGLDKNTQNLVLGANTWLRDQRNPSWTGDYFVGTMEDFNIYGRALSRAEVAVIGAPHDPPGPTQGTSKSGLDRLVDIIYADPGLYRNVPAQEIAKGAANADAMNGLIVEAIKATGVANDHMLNAADLRDVNAYLRANYAAKWVTLHGDDEDSAETGFHLVQNDGATIAICLATRTPWIRWPMVCTTSVSRFLATAC